MCGIVSAELPHLTARNFEHTLASDDVLAHFFNDFLSLPSFPEALLYNRETGLFEVASGEAECVSRRIRTALRRSKSQLLSGDHSLLSGTPPVDNRYSVWCLDRKQGIQWIMEKRLPLFLKSDCYIEYRLAKSLCESDPNVCIQRRRSSSGRSAPSPPRSSTRSSKENQNAPKVPTRSRAQENISSDPGSMAKYNLTCSAGQKELVNTKCREPAARCVSSSPEPEGPCTLPSLFPPCSSSPSRRCDGAQAQQGPQTEESSEVQLERAAARAVKQVLNNALHIVAEQRRGNKSGERTHCASEGKWCECKVCQRWSGGGRGGLEGGGERGQEGRRGSAAGERPGWDEESGEAGSWGVQRGNASDDCCHDTCCWDNRPGLDEFREFLRGTPGERLINLWMDIEKLKALQRSERKNRYLALMRSRYLLGNSQSSLNTVLLSRLGLTCSPCWTEDKLCSAQPCLTDALLNYWAPRFWKSQCVQEDHEVGPGGGLWTEWWSSPFLGRQPHWDPPLLPDNCRSSIPAHSQLYCSRSQLLGSRRVEEMLQALHVDSHAGLYFTHFCVQSGNQLWENAVYFWTDLQHYHELFYQDGLDTYRVQREAQLLYSTYLSTSARRSVGVDEEIRRKVYECLMPAFEELLDEVEEHTLDILLQPWMLLHSRDKDSFQKVRVQEEVHCLDCEEYRELQSMYGESERRQKEMQRPRSAPPLNPPFSKGAQVPDAWANVSPSYQGYRLGSLLRQPPEVGHFMSFLQEKDSSIHLACWLDLEQYKRTPQKDRAVKQERSSHLWTKYLNRKYFFGHQSPATLEQQNNILHLTGGLGMKLSNLVVVEIQEIVRNHIEEKWLPRFLSTAEFTERRRQKAQPRAADPPVVQQRSRTRRKNWKADRLWMSSSKEILLFRQILLNPVTCMQFQHFVSPRGDLLEKDLLFWLEVQKYKDLCHSHSDEATIQQKIATIIDCFINSSMPPTLQIDVPPEQARRILEEGRELGPYIFREAQMSVFGELFKFWAEFQELSSSVQEEQLLPLLQDKRVKHRARVRRRRRQEEEEDERRVQEEWGTREYGSREEDETDSGTNDDEEREWRSGSGEWRNPSQPLSWSYSKYMTALKREEVLLRKSLQLEHSITTASESSSCCFKSGDSLRSHGPSHRSSRSDSKLCYSRYNRR